jgi:hypothetical protein
MKKSRDSLFKMLCFSFLHQSTISVNGQLSPADAAIVQNLEDQIITAQNNLITETDPALVTYYQNQIKFLQNFIASKRKNFIFKNRGAKSVHLPSRSFLPQIESHRF